MERLYGQFKFNAAFGDGDDGTTTYDSMEQIGFAMLVVVDNFGHEAIVLLRGWCF